MSNFWYVYHRRPNPPDRDGFIKVEWDLAQMDIGRNPIPAAFYPFATVTTYAVNEARKTGLVYIVVDEHGEKLFDTSSHVIAT